MISVKTTRKIVECARAFGAKAVWVFGSSLTEGDRAPDIDVAVEGVAADRIFDLYVRLDRLFSKPVDLLDLSAPLSIEPLVRATGVRIYDRKEDRVHRIARRLGLEASLNPRGRPRAKK